MAVKIVEHWNTIPEKMDEYIDFMQKYRIPTMNNLGINIAALWSVLIGASPQIISEGIAEDLDRLDSALKSKDYSKTNTMLLHFVTDYKSKVLVPTGRFQHLPRVAKRSIVKFSQYWDIIPGKEDEYDSFIRNDFYPAMEELGIIIGGEWKILIGESPNILLEGRCNHAEILLKALNSRKFPMMKYKLLKLVTNYASRVLVFHAFKSMGSRSIGYDFYFV